jgi:hypothetical protein
MKTNAKTLCIVGTKGTLSPWTMECLESAESARGMSYDFVIWCRTPTESEYRTVANTLKTSEVGEQFWVCRKPK